MKKNSLILGALLGSIMPLMGYVLTTYTQWHTYIGGKALSFYAIGALLNLLLVRYCYKKGWDKCGQGIVLITFLAALLLIIFTREL